MRTEDRRRVMSGRERGFDGFLVRGKFADDSTAEDWKCKIDSKDVDLSPYVDADTKEFEYRQEEKPTRNLIGMFTFGKLERLYELSGTEKVQQCYRAFEGITTLKSVDLSKFDTSINYNMSVMFQNCDNLQFVDFSNSDTRRNVNFQYFFSGCKKLESVNIKFDVGNATDIRTMFNQCSSLSKIQGEIKNIKVSISLSACPLTADSAQVLIDGLSAEAAGQTITFSATTKALLSEEQKAQIAAKGWIMG